MRLFIAEKPSLARAIADGLGQPQRKGGGCIICGNDTITWCYGHMLELFEPEDYNAEFKRWRKESLPIIPERWRLKPRADASGQLNVISGLLKNAECAVNAGDPDREGQLLVDEVLEHLRYEGPVARIWLASLDARSVGKALASLTDNLKHSPLRDAARARSQADWLVGLNATRAMTIMGRQSGLEGVLPLGRVQTPTLNLVVSRDREIAAFKPQDFYVIQALFEHAKGRIKTNFVPEETQPGLDPHGRLIDPEIVSAIVESLREARGLISNVTREKKKKAPPLPHCLSSLQKAASARFGMSAQQVLDTAQNLYEKKLTSYPRSDCRYLPLEQFVDADGILGVLAGMPGLETAASNADSKLKSAAWDTKKVTAHHAIIPTGEAPGKLTGPERNIYNMIAMAYCLQFYPPMIYEAQKILIEAADKKFEAKGRLILDPGWTNCSKEEEEDEQEGRNAEQALPAVKKSDPVVCLEPSAVKKKTTPPSRFTEGTLIEAMANVHRFVKDAKAKAVLKENEGIGTEATRAGIIEGLKKRKYLQLNGKVIVSTPLASQIIDLTPATLKDPVTTAVWESKLELIAAGKSGLDGFMSEQAAALPGLLAPLLAGSAGGGSAGAAPCPCPVCGKAMLRRKSEKGFFWGCSGYPECRITMADDDGKPSRKANETITIFTCPDCGRPLILRRLVSKKSGKPYGMFSCSGYPACDRAFFSRNGRPDMEQGERREPNK